MTIAMSGCTACGAKLGPGQRFCASCGSPIAEAGASLQVAVGPRPEDRRHVTIVFADVTNSTPLAESLDAEDFRGLLGSVLRSLSREVALHGGTVDKYIGDAVMAVFGAPEAHEDDAERAVRAALGMQRAIEQLNDTAIEPKYHTRLALRVGVNTGEVVAGQLASDVQLAYTVVGDAVNTAQRVQSAAHPGEVVATAETVQQLGDLFELVPLEPLRVKGKGEAIPAFRVVRALGARRPAQRRMSSALVGRAAELRTLTERIERLTGGEGAIVLVTGEAGLGKSRLLAEAHAHRGRSELRWLEGSSSAFGERLAYQPFVQQLRSAIDARDDERPDLVLARLEETATRLLGPGGGDVVPYLATLLALPLPEAAAGRVHDLDPAAVGRQVFRAVRVFLEALAIERPLILAFEDLHWMDSGSTALLEHCAALVRSSALLVCATSRPDASAVARLREVAPERTVELALQPLSRVETGELLQNLLALDALPGSIMRVVEERGEGNPFFLEEVTRSLIDIGAVVRDGDEWRPTDVIEHVSLPTTLRGLIMARLDRLDADLAGTLKTASVIGRSFFSRILRRVDARPAQLDAALGTLERLELIAARARGLEPQYAFRHVLTQETAYESILLRTRRELHREVGLAIEELYPDRREEFSGALAYHFARAEDWERAQQYLFKAADQAGTVAADAEALAHYRDAFAAYIKAFGDRWEPLPRATLERKMAEALFRRGEHAESRLHLRRALEHLGRPLPGATGLRRAILREVLTQIGHRLAPTALIRRGGEAHYDVAAERARIYDVLGWIDYYDDPRRLVLYGLRVLNESEHDGYDRGIVQGSFGLGFVCDLIPLFGVAAGYHRRATQVAERIGVPLSLGYAYLGRAFHGHRLGDWSRALADWRRAADEFWTAGELRRWGAAMWGTSWLLLTTGRPDESRALAERMYKVGRDGGDPQVEGWGALLIGRNLWHAGELAQAEVRCREAIELLRRVPDHPNVAVTQGDLGASLLRQGRWRDAIAVLAEADRLMRERRLRGFLAQARNTFAEALLAGAEATAGEERAALLARADAALEGAHRQTRMDREGVPGYLRLRGTAAWLRGDTAAASARWRESLAAARALGAPYEEARTAAEAGRRSGDDTQLAAARVIFERLGAREFVAAAARPRQEPLD